MGPVCKHEQMMMPCTSSRSLAAVMTAKSVRRCILPPWCLLQTALLFQKNVNTVSAGHGCSSRGSFSATWRLSLILLNYWWFQCFTIGIRLYCLSWWFQCFTIGIGLYCSPWWFRCFTIGIRPCFLWCYSFRVSKLSSSSIICWWNYFHYFKCFCYFNELFAPLRHPWAARTTCWHCFRGCRGV